MKVNPAQYNELTAVYPLSPEEYRQLGLMPIYDGDSGYLTALIFQTQPNAEKWSQ